MDKANVPYYQEAAQYLEDRDLGLERWAREPSYMLKVAIRTIHRERNRLQAIRMKEKTGK